jgi:catechol 2,3-dioxygenase-like lactoylglutathione lyase family enzyme
VQILRLNHVQLTYPPGEDARALAFYGGVLELERLEKPGTLSHAGFWFAAGEAQIHLRPEVPGPVSARHPAFEVPDLAAAREALERVGLDCRDEVDVPGWKRFSFRDPFGNRIELMAADGSGPA